MKKTTKKITGIGLLVALSIILQAFDFAVPLMPSFIKFDLSDLPAIIGGFAYGPVSGVLVTFLKNLLHMTYKFDTLGIGELSNFLMAASFILPSSIIYHNNKTKKNAIISCIVGCLVCGVFCFVINLWIVYPLYQSALNFSNEAILGMYQAINPTVKTTAQALLIFNVPFTIIKMAITSFVCILIYKYIRIILK